MLPDPYRMMRKLYAEAKRRDATWACCQVLSALDSAAPDEALYFKRHRRNAPVPGDTRITEDDWQELVVHPDADPLLTRIFINIEAVIALDRGHSFEKLGIHEDDATDPATCAGTLVRSLEAAASAMRLQLPLLFVSPRATAPLAMARTVKRALVLSEEASRAALPEIRATFVAGAHLAYFRPGFYVRTLVPSLQGLKAWMLAAIKLVAPRLPVAAELEGATLNALSLLEQRLTGPTRDRLAAPVEDLMKRGGRADVARWVTGVDLTSDRVGLILADDLATALRTVDATGDAAAAVSTAARTRALLEYAVSREYLTLRDRLRLSLDWREAEQLDLDGDLTEVE